MTLTKIRFIRITILLTAVLFLSLPLHSQESLLARINPLITAGPLGILNTQENSAPSPIVFSVGAGAQIQILEQMSVSPHISFFANYYMWELEQVVPAEIEHRSAYVPSLLLDIPATWDIRTSNSIFRLGGGVSFLFRFALLANNVPSSVQEDIDNMNEWFWQGGEFFYPHVQLSWDYMLENDMFVGLGAKAYLPVGSLIKGQGVHNGIATIGIRLGF